MRIDELPNGSDANVKRTFGCDDISDIRDYNYVEGLRARDAGARGAQGINADPFGSRDRILRTRPA
jgi:hypothetical protein